MGLTIHYRFRLRDQARLPELTVEVESHRFDHVIDVEAKAMPFESVEGDPKPIRLNGNRQMTRIKLPCNWKHC
jgi:hypothetical protein